MPSTPRPLPPLLEIDNLSVAFAAASGPDTLVLDAVSLQLQSRGIIGLVGESGCGKSTLCRAILRTLRAPAYIAGGRINWGGEDLLERPPPALNQMRWRDIAMVVQSALDSLNPVVKIEAQLQDTMKAHGCRDGAENQRRIAQLIEMVGLHQRHLKAFPHELSGGMRQRVVIAMALALNPKLLIMDEPTTALDVVTQAEILGHILDLQESLGFAILLVTHDLPLALEFCHEIAVMYAGRIVEHGAVKQLGRQPQHPYTAGLLHSFPEPGKKSSVLRGVPGDPASFAALPSGCAFHPRCQQAVGLCAELRPELEGKSQGLSQVACHRPLASGGAQNLGPASAPVLVRSRPTRGSELLSVQP